MPMGCYSSRKKKLPEIPAWYTRDWFRSKFEQYFELVDESEIAENRILFIGKLHAGNDTAAHR
jgi:hypothetical protein